MIIICCEYEPKEIEAGFMLDEPSRCLAIFIHCPRSFSFALLLLLCTSKLPTIKQETSSYKPNPCQLPTISLPPYPPTSMGCFTEAVFLGAFIFSFCPSRVTVAGSVLRQKLPVLLSQQRRRRQCSTPGEKRQCQEPFGVS